MNFCYCKFVYCVILSGELTVKNFSKAIVKVFELRYNVNMMKKMKEMINSTVKRKAKTIAKIMIYKIVFALMSFTILNPC